MTTTAGPSGRGYGRQMGPDREPSNWRATEGLLRCLAARRGRIGIGGVDTSAV